MPRTHVRRDLSTLDGSNSLPSVPPPPYVDNPTLHPYHVHLASERARLRPTDHQGANLYPNYGGLTQPPRVGSGRTPDTEPIPPPSQPQGRCECDITASNKPSPTPFHILFGYMFIGLVIGYLFNNTFNAVSWNLEETNHERARTIWKREETEHQTIRSRMLADQATWRNDKIIRDAERERWERVEREGRAGIMWENIMPSDKCLRYGTKEYTGVLSHVPPGFDAMQECMRKPALINGQEQFPVRCEDPGSCGKVIGHWEVDNEALCSPNWGRIYDKGCDGNYHGKRRFEGHLMNLHRWNEWHVICPTAPVDIRGHHFNGPESCADWGLRGIWGIWFLEDLECRK